MEEGPDPGDVIAVNDAIGKSPLPLAGLGGGRVEGEFDRGGAVAAGLVEEGRDEVGGFVDGDEGAEALGGADYSGEPAMGALFLSTRR